VRGSSLAKLSVNRATGVTGDVGRVPPANEGQLSRVRSVRRPDSKLHGRRDVSGPCEANGWQKVA
jgi:hypothetical protein